MKTSLKIILGLGLLIGLTILYIARYSYIKAGDDTLLFLNPFQLDQKSFDDNYKKAESSLATGDTSTAKKYFEKALKFHGTFNERQRENIYSDANDLWEYKCDKRLKYSRAYDFLGQTDSAISCLSPGLTSFEKWHYPIDKRFFELTVKKIGRQKTIALINSGLDKTGKPDCYHCCDYFYKFDEFRIGIDENEFDLVKSDRKKLLADLCDKYGI